MNHITIGVYSNKEYVYNIVAEKDLSNHIEYNKKMRPGRIFYVDGKRVNSGFMKDLSEYDKLATAIYNRLLKEGVQYKSPSIPYI